MWHKERGTMATVAADGAPRDVSRLGPQLYNGIEKGSLAYKLMSSMGWREGEGLVRKQ